MNNAIFETVVFLGMVLVIIVAILLILRFT